MKTALQDIQQVWNYHESQNTGSFFQNAELVAAAAIDTQIDEISGIIGAVTGLPGNEFDSHLAAGVYKQISPAPAGVDDATYTTTLDNAEDAGLPRALEDSVNETAADALTFGQIVLSPYTWGVLIGGYLVLLYTSHK